MAWHSVILGILGLVAAAHCAPSRYEFSASAEGQGFGGNGTTGGQPGTASGGDGSDSDAGTRWNYDSPWVRPEPIECAGWQDRRCPGDLVCAAFGGSGQYRCVQCSSHDQCTWPTPYCDTSSTPSLGSCVNCLPGTTYCDNGQSCNSVNKQCEPMCGQGFSCGSGQFCDEAWNPMLCGECNGPNPCERGSCTYGVCYECGSNKDCMDSNRPPRCYQSKCVECFVEGQCSDTAYCGADHYCHPNP